MDKDNLPAREAEFFIMRSTQLPAHMIGGQPHQQSVQINCNIFSTDTPEQAVARIKRAENYVHMLQSLHEARFIEGMIETTGVRMTSEMDVLEALQEEARKLGKAMKQQRRDMMTNLPAQVEKTKQQLDVLRAELDKKREAAGNLL